MLKKVLLALIVIVAIFVIVVSTRPGTFHIERSATMSASPEAVYAEVADFHEWAQWSVWDKRDPQMQKTYTGAGVGATYHWSGNNDVGEGQMTFTELRPTDHVAIQLDFIKPFKSTCQTTFAIVPDAGGTKVTWTMEGKADFITKAMSMFSNMDSMVGPDFEKGLAGLATAAAAAPTPVDTTVAPAK